MTPIVMPRAVVIDGKVFLFELCQHFANLCRRIARVIQIVQIPDDVGDVVRALVQRHDDHLRQSADQISIVPLLFPLPQSIRCDVPFGAELPGRVEIALLQQNLADLCRRMGFVWESG